MIKKEDWCSLSGVVEATARQIWNSDKLPGDLRLSFDELRSDCYAKCGYLVNNYKSGELSLKSYVFEWLEKKVVDAIMHDYKQHHKAALTYIDAGTYDEEDNYVEPHEYGEYEVAAYFDDKKKYESYEALKSIYDKANKLDKMIIDMILDGKEITAVAEEVGISARQIYRRLQKYNNII